MTSEEIVAYIGAAAWLPQIASWIYGRYSRPSIRVVPDRYAEAGFTSFGPIFNLRIALSAENKDIVLDGMELIVCHQDGESRTLRWAGIGETLSQITDSAGNKQVVSRDESPIAIKVGTQSLLEKFVRFQEPRYHEGDRPLINAVVSHFNYLRVSKPSTYVEDVLNSKELFCLLKGRREAFWWKPGRYRLALQLTSPQKFSISNQIFSFELTAHDIQILQGNVAVLEAEIKNIIQSNRPDFQAQPINWAWANVDVHQQEIKKKRIG